MLGIIINFICCPEVLVLPGNFMEKIHINKFSGNRMYAKRVTQELY